MAETLLVLTNVWCTKENIHISQTGKFIYLAIIGKYSIFVEVVGLPIKRYKCTVSTRHEGHTLNCKVIQTDSLTEGIIDCLEFVFKKITV